MLEDRVTRQQFELHYSPTREFWRLLSDQFPFPSNAKNTPFWSFNTLQNGSGSKGRRSKNGKLVCIRVPVSNCRFSKSKSRTPRMKGLHSWGWGLKKITLAYNCSSFSLQVFIDVSNLFFFLANTPFHSRWWLYLHTLFSKFQIFGLEMKQRVRVWGASLLPQGCPESRSSWAWWGCDRRMVLRAGPWVENTPECRMCRAGKWGVLLLLCFQSQT